MSRKLSMLAASLLAIGLTGCAGTGNIMATLRSPQPMVCTTSIADVGYVMANELASQMDGKIDKDKPLMVTSMADLDDLEESSTAGRLVGEHMGTRFTQLGVKVMEPRLRKAVSVSSTGEFALTREAADLAMRNQAQAYVVGTVAKVHGKHYFNGRVIRLRDSQILAAYDVCMSGSIR